MEKIGTKEMVQEISKRMGCYHKDVREVLDHFTNIMVENVCEGRKVQFIPLGVFSPAKIRHRNAGNVAGNVNEVKIKFKQSTIVTRKLVNNVNNGAEHNGAEHAENEKIENQQVS